MAARNSPPAGERVVPNDLIAWTGMMTAILSVWPYASVPPGREVFVAPV